MSETKEKTGWFARLKQGLRKTQVNLVGIFTGGVVDEAFLEDLEFQMISADIGVETSALILERLRERIKLKGLKTQDEVKVALKEIIADILRPCEASLNFDEQKPLVIMMCGVNGAGKTTTCLSWMEKRTWGCCLMKLCMRTGVFMIRSVSWIYLGR